MSSKVSIIVALLILTSCATPKVIQDYQRDSVNVMIKDSIRFRDSLVLVPVPQGSDKAVIPDSDTSRLETDVAESVAWVADGKMHHSLRNKDAAIIPVTIKVPERLHYESKDRLIYNRIIETIEVEKQLSRWQQFLLSLGWVVIIAGTAWSVWKVSKVFR